MLLADEWERLCNELDSAWRDYIRASRIIRDKVKPIGRQPETQLTLAEFAREHRAWIRVMQAREKLNSFLQERVVEQKPVSQRRSSR